MADSLNQIASSTSKLDDIYKRLMTNEYPAPVPGQNNRAAKNSNGTGPFESRGQLSTNGIDAGRKFLTAAEDAALGAGQVFSQATSSLLLQQITPKIVQLGAASGRAAGGLTTLLTSGYRIVQRYRQENAQGSTNFPQTRREVFVSGASIAGSFAVGSAAGLATSAAVVFGAPAIVVGGIAAAGVIGAGYAAYKIRDLANGFYSRVTS